jgi:hypothetical protein
MEFGIRGHWNFLQVVLRIDHMYTFFEKPEGKVWFMNWALNFFFCVWNGQEQHSSH